MDANLLGSGNVSTTYHRGNPVPQGMLTVLESAFRAGYPKEGESAGSFKPSRASTYGNKNDAYTLYAMSLGWQNYGDMLQYTFPGGIITTNKKYHNYINSRRQGAEARAGGGALSNRTGPPLWFTTGFTSEAEFKDALARGISSKQEKDALDGPTDNGIGVPMGSAFGGESNIKKYLPWAVGLGAIAFAMKG